ncbi:MAG: glutamyl-tRNA reductase [Bacteroidia bacterium]
MLKNSFVVGINHHQTDASKRGLFSLNESKQATFMCQAFRQRLQSVCILNTCNRTEIYGYGDIEVAIKLFGELTDKSIIHEPNLIKLVGKAAVEHIFKVASGLDSQIIGDLEILGQFKSAFYFSKQNKALNGYFERLANTAIQAAKEVRSSTNLSSGTVSLSYAATKYIKRNFNNKEVKILLVGTGEFGKRIAYNINDYLSKASIAICNRTRQKAEEIANKINCKVEAFEELDKIISNYDIIISSVNNTGKFIIDKNNAGDEPKVFIDMSIPFSIDPSLAQQKHTIVTLDEVSKEISQTIESRKEHIPLALAIIDKHIEEFSTWAEIFEKSESMQQWKNMMMELSHTCPHLSSMAQEHKNRVIGRSMAQFALYVKNRTDLPKETQKVIEHFLIESDKAIACKKAEICNQPLEVHNCSACQSK